MGSDICRGDVGIYSRAARVRVFDDNGSRKLTQRTHQPPGGISVIHIQVRHLLASVLLSKVPATPSGEGIPRSNLMRIFAIAKFLTSRRRQMKRLRQRASLGQFTRPLAVKPSNNRCVISGSVSERISSQAAAGDVCNSTTCSQLTQHHFVIDWVHQDGHL